MAINCAALPESLLESELFGYEEGAFTGAKRGGKIGLFELAHQGTVYLDEIADISAGLQMRLLRVIENKEVMRVGGDRYVPVDVRIISSSYKDLHREMKKDRFRPDLYYRLAVLKLKLPALRERKEDIPLIIEALLESRATSNSAFTPKMLAYLNRYHWPGNVRELISFVESYLILLKAKNHDEQLIAMLLEEQMEEASHWEEAPSEDDAEAACDINADEYMDGTLKEMMEQVDKGEFTRENVSGSLEAYTRKLGALTEAVITIYGEFYNSLGEDQKVTFKELVTNISKWHCPHAAHSA